MTITRRLARAGFTLTRSSPLPSRASGRRSPRKTRSSNGSATATPPTRGEWVFDFRVGGRDVAEATFHNGPVSRFEATYTDIVEETRIVNTYDMWLDGVHMSTSVASFEFEPIDDGTRLTHIEHGVFFDQFWADGPNREAGSRGILETLGNYLT